MEARVSHNSNLLAIWAMPVVCVLLWVATASSQIIDVYQWTDSNGIINFTDNLKSVPEALRNSPELIVRKDLFIYESTASQSASPQFPGNVSLEPPAPRSYAVEYKPTVIYNPQITNTVIQVNSGVGLVSKRHFPRHYGYRKSFYGKSFRRKPLGIQYIHPEARSGRRIQYIHPGARRQTRSFHRRGFAGRRSFHRSLATGRRR